MGFLGTADEFKRYFGRRLSRFSGIVQKADTANPPLSDSIIQWLTETSDGLIIDDKIGTLDPVTAGDVTIMTFDGATGYSILTEKLPARDFLKIQAKVRLRSDGSFTVCGAYDGNLYLNFCVVGYFSSVYQVRFRVGAVADNQYCSAQCLLTSAAAAKYDNGMHDIELTLDFNSPWECSYSIDGVYAMPYAAYLDKAPRKNAVINAVGRHNSASIGATYNLADMGEIKIFCDNVLVLHHPHEEGSGSINYDVSGNANHGAITGTCGWTTEDGLPSWNLLKGCDSYSEEIEIPKYYNDAKMACMITMDDMFKDGVNDTVRWDRFMNTAQWLSDEGVVASSGLIVNPANRMVDTTGWTLATAEMAAKNGYHLFGNHSYLHPTVWEQTEEQNIQEFVTSKQIMLANLIYPANWSYKGTSFITTMLQFGGWGAFPYSDLNDPAWDVLNPILANANYLGMRSAYTKTGASFGYPFYWDSSLGMFLDFSITTSAAYIIADDPANYQANWTHAYNNEGFYMMYLHPWEDDYYFGGANAAKFETWLSYISGHANVWYTDPDSFLNYKYMRRVNPPQTKYELSGNDVIITVVGDSAARLKYGLSTPLTYKIKKPDTWGTDDAEVYYRDAVDTEWVLMDEKTSLDVFSQINCFRNAGTAVYVNQGLPQTVDAFQVKIVRVV